MLPGAVCACLSSPWGWFWASVLIIVSWLQHYLRGRKGIASSSKSKKSRSVRTLLFSPSKLKKDAVFRSLSLVFIGVPCECRQGDGP